MTNFTIGPGVVKAGEHVYLHVDELPHDKVKELLAETQAVAAERGLTQAESTSGQLAVDGTTGFSVIEQPGLLIATVNESGTWYTKVTNELNGGRNKSDRVPVVPEDELANRAEEWLNEERLRAAEKGLFYDSNNPLMLLALPNAPVSHQEIIDTWANARGARFGQWGGGLAFLERWPADKLSGFNPHEADEPVRCVILETASEYEEERSGDRDQQLELLEGVRDHQTVRPVSLFEGGVYVNRFGGREFFDWHRSDVSQIELEPDKPSQDGRVPSARAGALGVEGIGSSGVTATRVSRRLVE